MPPLLWRKTTQELAPLIHRAASPDTYDLYPGFPLGPGKIQLGLASLAEHLAESDCVMLDGYGGLFWEELRAELDDAFRARGLAVAWRAMETMLRPETEIEAWVAPFLGGDDPIFGTRFTGELRDFFDEEKLRSAQLDPDAALTIFYGCGAALTQQAGALVYVDLPKNEIQFRARAGSICNLGASRPSDGKSMYKRFYFVDWVALNRHKAALASAVDFVVDGQRPDAPVWLLGDDLRAGLTAMSQNYFRVRPWFEPGPWGGQWIKAKIPHLPQDAPNYAWSFELIVPENGLLLESDSRLLEVSFDWLMAHDHRAILGECADTFGLEFPIRFDFLDTFDGGNLSVQCHPRPDFIRTNFGERFTQDETYYILDCEEGAKVYLGFKEEIDPVQFRAALEQSFAHATAVDIDQFVNSEPAHKHDLFLIPHGTIHCSGRDVMVLEISATPYIFTFKLYDWLRLDLDGRPRPLNLARGFANLDFTRKGVTVRAELVAGQRIIAQGADWQLVHLPTHPVHFYDVHRWEFDTVVDGVTDGSCRVMSLVEGTSVRLETAGGLRRRFAYAETFVVPAAAGAYRLVNEGPMRAKVVCAFVKPDLPATF